MVEKIFTSSKYRSDGILIASNLFSASAVPAAIDNTICEEYEDGHVVQMVVRKGQMISLFQKTIIFPT